MKLLLVLNLLGLLLSVRCKFVFFERDLQNAAFYKCIKPTVGDLIMLFLDYDSDYNIDPTSLENIRNAQSVGLAVELVYVPNRCRETDKEIEFLQKGVDLSNIGRIWIALESFEQECLWQNFTPEDNCRYLTELIVKARKADIKMQIASLIDDWMQAFQNELACPQASNALLWWIDPTLQPFSQFGGWEKPYLKLITQSKLCGKDIFVSTLQNNP